MLTNLKQQQTAAGLEQELMCRRLLDYAYEFYKDPKNQEAFEKWLADGQPSIRTKYSEVKANKRKTKK